MGDRGFDSPQLHKCDVSGHRKRSEPLVGFGSFRFSGSVGACGSAGGLIVAVGVEGEGVQDLAGGGVVDAVVADGVMRVGVMVAGCGFGSGGVATAGVD